MAGVLFGAFVIYYLIRKNPNNANRIITTTNEYIKYLPIDSGAASILSPILDFTSKHHFAGGQSSTSNSQFNNGDIDNPILAMPPNRHEQRISQSGQTQSGQTELRQTQSDSVKKTKRSVSETKKKFVAARQNWRCSGCNKQLTAWFEVDHKIRLEYGGSNHIDNLVAMCRECHGEKTTMENL